MFPHSQFDVLPSLTQQSGPIPKPPTKMLRVHNLDLTFGSLWWILPGGNLSSMWHMAVLWFWGAVNHEQSLKHFLICISLQEKVPSLWKSIEIGEDVCNQTFVSGRWIDSMSSFQCSTRGLAHFGVTNRSQNLSGQFSDIGFCYTVTGNHQWIDWLMSGDTWGLWQATNCAL